MEEHHDHPRTAPEWAKVCYYLTYVTGGLAMVFGLINAWQMLSQGESPHLTHLLAVVSIVATSLMAIPYLWSKPVARFKLFGYVIGWSVVLLMQLICFLRYRST